MATDRFLIAPYNSGLQRDVRPWLLPDDAFQSLYNMYVWRGFVRKRVGSCSLLGTNASTEAQFYTRLRMEVDTIMAGGATGLVPTGTPLNVKGQMFTIAGQIFTVNATGSPANMLNTTGLGTGTYDTATGEYTFTGLSAPNGTPVYFYPSLPVMAFPTLYTTATNFERYFAFDTRFAYEYQGSGGWQRLDLGASTWSGTDSDFHYAVNYQGNFDYEFFLFVVNNTEADGIRYFDATTNTWTQYTRSYSASANTEILTCRIVIQFKNRLLFLNTVEEPGAATPQRYQNRCRYSQIGSVGSMDAFYQPPGTYGRGGFVDAPTQQQIISAEILRDRLIVGFEQSTWELVYQNNEIAPFKWVNLNIELGLESTNSLVPMDKALIGIGDVGIHACNGVNVNRIDLKIPDEVYEISNINNGIDRVFGIRDYDAELIYWSIPNISTPNDNLIYPNQLLVYNYRNETWAIFDDSITAFGYIRLNEGVTWGQLDYLTWGEWNDPWGKGQEQRRQPRVLAGNQEGFTFYMDRDTTENAISLQLTDIVIDNTTVNSTYLILTMMNHNVVLGDFVQLHTISGSGSMADLNEMIVEVIGLGTAPADEILVVVPKIITGIYSGGGTVSLVSNINIITKQYNFYLDQGVNFSINKIDLQVTSTPKNDPEIDPTDPGGEITVIAFPNSGSQVQSDGTVLLTDSMILTTAPYNEVYYPYEQFQERLWHSLYPNLYGSFIQLVFQWSSDQMIDPRISLKNVQIHAMMFHTQITDSRLQ